MSSQKKRPRWRFIFKVAVISVSLYMLVATAMMIGVAIHLRTMDLEDLEPPAAEVVPRPEQIPTYGAGVYGPDNPLGPVQFEGKTPRTTINKQGLRDKVELGPDMGPHIVLLGDSFTFGYGLDDDQTLAAHLGKLDPSHRYINAGQPLFNLHDSVTRFNALWATLPAPRVVLLQVLLSNDITSEQQVEVNIARIYEAANSWRLPPFNNKLLDPLLLDTLHDRVWKLLNADLNRARFDLYIKGAIERLRASIGSETTLALVLFTDSQVPGHTQMMRWTSEYCGKIRVPMWRVEDLVDGETFENPRLSDGHPSGAFNRHLAQALAPRFKELISGKPR